MGPERLNILLRVDTTWSFEGSMQDFQKHLFNVKGIHVNFMQHLPDLKVKATGSADHIDLLFPRVKNALNFGSKLNIHQKAIRTTITEAFPTYLSTKE